MPIRIESMVDALPSAYVRACSTSCVVLEKAYSMPPRTPCWLACQKERGSVAPAKPRQTVAATVSFDSLRMQELHAWMLVAYLLPSVSSSQRRTRKGAPEKERSVALYLRRGAAHAQSGRVERGAAAEVRLPPDNFSYMAPVYMRPPTSSSATISTWFAARSRAFTPAILTSSCASGTGARAQSRCSSLHWRST